MGSFGYRLKKIREERGFTQERLAVACKTSEPVIRHYEKERKKPGYDMMLRICDALRVNPDYLMQDDLSFNPYEDKNETFNAIAKLSPKNYKLLKDFVESLSNQDNEK